MVKGNVVSEAMKMTFRGGRGTVPSHDRAARAFGRSLLMPWSAKRLELK